MRSCSPPGEIVLSVPVVRVEAQRGGTAQPDYDAYTFVDLAGGHVYPEKVRESEAKPIRIFMIDGRNDNRGLDDDGSYDETRDWFYQNVRLKDALLDTGHDVNYSWGIGVHSHDMGGAMLPEMMRWLWRDQLVSLDPHDDAERSFREAR